MYYLTSINMLPHYLGKLHVQPCNFFAKLLNLDVTQNRYLQKTLRSHLNVNQIKTVPKITQNNSSKVESLQSE